MLRKLGLRQGPRRQAGAAENKAGSMASTLLGGPAKKTHRSSASMGGLPDTDVPLMMMPDTELEDDFNLLEESPDGGKTFYSGGRDATGQRETVRWEGVGLIKTPRSKQRPTLTRSNSMPSAAERAERAVRVGAAPEVNKALRLRPVGRMLRRQRSMPLCYRELRAMKVQNQSADVKRRYQRWRMARELELDQLRKQWIAYQRTARRGKSRARKSLCKSQPALDLAKHQESPGCSAQPSTKIALRERQVQSPVDVMSVPGKRQRRLERPFARELFMATPSPRTSLPDSGCSRHSTDSATPLSPAPDYLLEEALAIASRFSNGDQAQELSSSGGRSPMERIAAAGQLLRRNGGQSPSEDTEKGRATGALGGTGKSSQLPGGPRSSPLKTPRGQTTPARSQQVSTKPPRNLGSATPRGSRTASSAKASLGGPARCTSKSKTADARSDGLKTAPALGAAQRTTPKRRTMSAVGLPPSRGGSSGLGSSTPRSEPTSTPRGTPRSVRRPQQSSPPEGRLRKSPVGKAAPSPRPGLGPAVRVGVPHTPGPTPRRASTPRESGSNVPSKLGARSSLGTPQRLSKSSMAKTGDKIAKGKAAGALSRVSSSARRLPQ